MLHKRQLMNLIKPVRHVQVTFHSKLKKKEEETFAIYGAPGHDMWTKIYFVATN